MDLPSTISGGWALLLLILGFGFIIFVHELGHFLVAKAVGIKCTQFAIGFGQALVCWRKGIGFRVGTTEPAYHKRIREHLAAQRKEEPDPEDQASDDEEPEAISERDAARAAEELGLGETEYRLNWMPLGGYVKMVGQEDLDPAARSEDPRAFNNKPIWARVCVVSAGVVMNTIFAVLFFVVAFLHGVEFPPAEVGGVVPGSPAAAAQAVDHPDIVGLQPGDRAIRVNGEKPSDFTNIRIASALAGPGDSVDLLVERPSTDGQSDQRLRFLIRPEVDEDMQGLLYIGLSPPSSLRIVEPATPRSQLAAIIAEMGMRPGMVATHVNGQPVEAYWQFDRLLQQSDGKPLSIRFEDDLGHKEVTIRPATQMQQVTRSASPAPEDYRQTVPHLLGLIPASKISAVSAGSAAEGALESGDIIVSLNGVDWPTLPVVQYLIGEAGSTELPITVLRDGEHVELTVTPRRDGWLDDPVLGVGLEWATDTPLIADVLSDSPFAESAWPAGTIIQQIDGETVDGFSDIRLAIEQSGSGPIEVESVIPIAGGQTETQTLSLDESVMEQVASLRWEASGMPPLAMLRELQKASSPWEAMELGAEKTWLFMEQTYVTLARLIQGSVQVRHLRGPLGIADEGTRIAEKGWAYLMFFLGLISINLAVINFLPLPIVDGGLFVLLMVEKARGRPVSPGVLSVINLAGLVLLGTLALVVTYHDVVRLVTG